MQDERREFRQALSQFATGVAVVTAQDDAGEAVGMTMSSFNSVSLDPPLILFSVDRKAMSLAAMERAKGYAVNILGRDQEALSNQFARSLAEKWRHVVHAPGHQDAPLLHGALAHFECEPWARHDGGDHVIFIGRVVRHSFRASGAPLIFFRGKYHGVSAGDESEAPWPLSIHYW